MSHLIFNCLGIGFIAGGVLGYVLGYGDAELKQEEERIFRCVRQVKK